MPRPFHLVCRDGPSLAALEACFAPAAGSAHWHREGLRRCLLDSADRRLRDAGQLLVHDLGGDDDTGTLTLCDREGQQLVAPTAGCRPPCRPAALADARLRTTVAAVLRPRALLAVRRWEVERCQRPWLNEDEKIIGDLVLERHTWPDGALVTVTARPRRGYRREFRAALAAVFETLDARPLALAPDGLLDERLTGEWDRPLPPPALSSEAPAGAAIASRLAYFRAVMRANEAGIRADLDIEFLHDFRVALRRARSLVQAFEDILGDVAALKEGFAWLSSETSPLRDLDVWLDALEDGEARVTPRLEAHLRTRRRREQARLARLLGGRRYQRLQDDWAAWLEQLAARETGAPVLRKLVDKAIRRRHRRLCRRRHEHGRVLPPAALHEIRKDAKKLRYLLDAFASLYPRKRAGRVTKALKRLQTIAGAICDRWAHASLLVVWRDAATDDALGALFAAELEHLALPAELDLDAPENAALARALDGLCGPDGLDSLRRLCDKGRR